MSGPGSLLPQMAACEWWSVCGGMKNIRNIVKISNESIGLTPQDLGKPFSPYIHCVEVYGLEQWRLILPPWSRLTL